MGGYRGVDQIAQWPLFLSCATKRTTNRSTPLFTWSRWRSALPLPRTRSFCLSPLSGLTLSQIITTGDYRFVGATLLHVLASATIGASMALAFYKPRRLKRRYLLAGVILAIALHAAFNVLIISSSANDLLRTFIFVWAGLVALLALIEFVKRMPTPRAR